jgi:superfamily I DNA/RNA helicase
MWILPSEISDALAVPDQTGKAMLTKVKVGKALKELGYRDHPEACHSQQERTEAGHEFTMRFYDWSIIGEELVPKLLEMWPELKLKANGDITLTAPPNYMVDRDSEIDEARQKAAAAETREWSPYQKAIFVEMRGDGNLVVIARAGSGKTSTIIESLSYLSPSDDILLTAFNKSIQVEMAEKAPSYVDVKTSHSIGFGLVRRNLGLSGKDLLDVKKVPKLAGRVLKNSKYDDLLRAQHAVNVKKSAAMPWAKKRKAPDEEGAFWDARRKVFRLVGLMKNTLTEDDAAIAKLYDDYDIGDTDSKPMLIQAAKETMEKSNAMTDVIDFDDMLWLPYYHRFKKMTKYDVVLVDEAQDLNAAQIWLIKRLCRKGGRIITVGDDRQCQPAGTLVSTPGGGRKAIQDLKDGDAVVAWNRHGKSLVGREKELYRVKVGARPYEGELVTIRVGDHKTRCTPNHRWTVKTLRKTGLWVVYLMRRASDFRVGWCQLFDKNSNMHLAQRTRLEKADSAWILSVHNGKSSASLEESLVSHRFNIPLVQFAQSVASPTAGLLDQKYFDDFWSVIGRQEENVRRCLDDHGRDYAFPFYTQHGKRGRTTVMEVTASNLFHEFMQIPVDVGNKTPEWSNFAQSREYYSGMVYSLDVPKYGHYIADGLVTHNSIYGFRGADRHAIDRIIEGLDAKTLPLSVSYRCPSKVVFLAQEVVKDIEPAPNAEEGIVRTVNYGNVVDGARPGDFVLSRTNAPLMGVCLELLRRNVPATVAGKDIGAAIQALVKKSRCGSINELNLWLGIWLKEEHEKSKRRPRYFQLQADKVAALRILMDDCRGISDIVTKLDRMFSDDTPTSRVICSTVHKAKGLERKRVWMLNSTFYLSYEGVDKIEEENIWYVAVTRSMSELYLCDTPVKEILSGSWRFDSSAQAASEFLANMKPKES